MTITEVSALNSRYGVLQRKVIFTNVFHVKHIQLCPLNVCIKFLGYLLQCPLQILGPGIYIAARRLLDSI